MSIQTLYGRTGILSNVITKAREKVRGFYGLNGKVEIVRDGVEWLLKESHFMYGDVDFQVWI